MRLFVPSGQPATFNANENGLHLGHNMVI